MNPYHILIIIVAYFTILFIISHFTSRKANSDTFFIGNRKSPWYLVSFAMIGTSISGVTFISVPGWVLGSKFYYMQLVLGYLLGYATIIHVLLPIYYKLNLTTIYTYLATRFGKISYKTGASFFLLSRLVGSSLRLFLVTFVLQETIFKHLNVPFFVTIIGSLILIYAYTFRGGVKTIVWTDSFQTLLFLLAVIFSIVFVGKLLNLDFKGLVGAIYNSEYSTVFNFTHWREGSFFLKQFLSGAFIAIVMTGLDQDMMQKNLSCRTLRDSQKNMYWYSALLVPVNLLFLSLGALLVLYSQQNGIPIPDNSDKLYPLLATGGYFPVIIGIVFILGLIAAAYSSADSALTALTTSFTINILGAGRFEEKKLKRVRWIVHILMSLLTGLFIYIFNIYNSDAVIDTVFTAAIYTYGPLLGLFAFGIFSKRKVKDPAVPFIAILSPLFTYLVKLGLGAMIENYKSSYELLVVNGIITILGLLIFSRKAKQ